MKSAIVLAAVCAAGSAIAGPMGQHGSHGKHAHFHHHHGGHGIGPGGYVPANVTTTSQQIYAATGGAAVESPSVLQNGEPAVTADNAPATTGLQVLSTTDGLVHALSPVTDTVMKTVYTTYTYNVGAGSSAIQTTTQYASVVTEYVTSYVTVTVGIDGTGPSPAPTADTNNEGQPSPYNTGSIAVPLVPALEPVTSEPGADSNNQAPAGAANAGYGAQSVYHDPYQPKPYSNISAPAVANATGLHLNMKVVAHSTTKTTTKTSAKSTVKVVSTTKRTSVKTSSTIKAVSTTKRTSAKTTSTVQANKVVVTSAKSSVTTSKTSTTSKGVATVAAPGPTGTGTVSGCTKWYVAKSGDYCALIAQNNGIATDTFMSWNPSVNPPSCNAVYIGNAYCVAIGGNVASSASSTKALAATSKSVSGSAGYASTKTSSAASAHTSTKTSVVVPAPTSSKTSSAASAPTSGSYAYKMYTGNGTVAAGWPVMTAWVDFTTMWNFNVPIMQQSCTQFGVANNSPTEIANIKSAIQSVASSSGVDARFILAIVMQESNGCVRVPTTSWSVQNPGLMQDHNGAGSCNRNGVIQNPCPASEITQMITDGTTGTADGDGLVQCIKETGMTTAQVARFYRAARIYNGGLGGYNPNDLGSGCCTLCYSSDVANRLMGWHSGPSTCTLK